MAPFYPEGRKGSSFWRENHTRGLWELSHEKPFLPKFKTAARILHRTPSLLLKPGSRQQTERAAAGRSAATMLGRSRAEVSLSCLTERPAFRNSLSSLAQGVSVQATQHHSPEH